MQSIDKGSEVIKIITDKLKIEEAFDDLFSFLWDYIEVQNTVIQENFKAFNYWYPRKLLTRPNRGDGQNIYINPSTGDLMISYCYYRYGESDYDYYTIRPAHLNLTLEEYKEVYRTQIIAEKKKIDDENLERARKAQETRKINEKKRIKEEKEARKKLYQELKAEFESPTN